jgi:uncharacterized protein (DUF1501 family)
MAGARLNSVTFGSAEDEPNQEILVSIFLRGGIDVLSLIPPIAGPDRGHYEDARTDLQIPVSGLDAALPLDSQFGLHPAAAGLHTFYQANKLALVLAVGMNEDTRSHFDAMTYMELGTPGSKTIGTGWITRHMQSAANLPEEILMPSLAIGSTQPTSMLGNHDAIAMSSPGNFNLNTGPWAWRNAQRHALRQMYGGSTSLHQAGIQALNAVDIIETNDTDNYTPANGAVYPDGSFGDHLQVVAQMIKLQLGLRTATIDLGGWDTHENQAYGVAGYFYNQVQLLSDGLAAFYTDLDGAGSANYTQRLIVVLMTEFGRRFRENDDRGTDHGHGSAMMVLGGKVNGGIYGEWPGLHNNALYDGADLEVMTDYRRVLSEILIRRLANPQLGTVFPGYTDYSPLGIVQGQDLTPVYAGLPLDNSVYIPVIST